jgi:hypothetical protein
MESPRVAELFLFLAMTDGSSRLQNARHVSSIASKGGALDKDQRFTEIELADGSILYAKDPIEQIQRQINLGATRTAGQLARILELGEQLASTIGPTHKSSEAQT